MYRTTLTCLAFVGAASYSPAVNADDAASDPFAGEWSVSATPDDDAADGQGRFSEAVLFHDGQFSAAVFAMFGFSPAAYTVKLDGGQPVFVATLASGDRGTLVWSGRQTATGLGGTLVWTRADGAVTHYTLVGERQ